MERSSQGWDAIYCNVILLQYAIKKLAIRHAAIKKYCNTAPSNMIILQCEFNLLRSMKWDTMSGFDMYTKII